MIRYVDIHLGGIAYNMQVDARHAGTIAELAVHLATGALTSIWQKSKAWPKESPAIARLGEIVHMHTSVLPQGRYTWLETMIAMGASGWAITMDADTWIEPGEAITFLSRLPPDPSDDLAIIAAVVPTRDVRVNVWIEPGQRIAKDEIAAGRLTRVRQVGLALAAYNLEWYAKRTPDERHGMFAIVPGGQKGAFVGEDIWHCEWVNRHKGDVWITGLDVPTVHGDIHLRDRTKQ